MPKTPVVKKKSKADLELEKLAKWGPLTKLLTELFETVEEQFRTTEIKAYQNQAKAQLTGWLDRVDKGPVPGVRSYLDNYPPQYVSMDAAVLGADKWRLSQGADSLRFVEYVKIKELGGFSANLKLAKSDANKAVDYAKAHFVHKQALKLVNALASRTDIPVVTGELEFAGLILGHLQVAMPNGDGFRLEMKMIGLIYEPANISIDVFPGGNSVEILFPMDTA